MFKKFIVQRIRGARFKIFKYDKLGAVIEVMVMVADILMVLLAWIHVLAVVVWLGGAIFFTFIVVPNLSGLPPQEAGKLSGGISKQFMPIAWVAAVVLAITGLLRMFLAGTLNTNILLNSSYGVSLLLKLLIFVVIVIIAALITTTAQKLEKPESPEVAMVAQKRVALLAKMNIALITTVILLAAGVRYGGF
ncbi:MAG: DUF4149 domain-containing protein [Candidatus Hydrothermarchaeaceae archaeon]